jgi:hypothetical protein
VRNNKTSQASPAFTSLEFIVVHATQFEAFDHFDGASYRPIVLPHHHIPKYGGHKVKSCRSTNNIRQLEEILGEQRIQQAIIYMVKVSKHDHSQLRNDHVKQNVSNKIQKHA